jgi:hypothetical protein
MDIMIKLMASVSQAHAPPAAINHLDRLDDMSEMHKKGSACVEIHCCAVCLPQLGSAR